MFKNLFAHGSAALALSAAAVSAQAAVPAGVATIFTDAAADFGTLLGYGYVALGVVLTGMIVMGLTKKVAKKATSG